MFTRCPFMGGYMISVCSTRVRLSCVRPFGLPSFTSHSTVAPLLHPVESRSRALHGAPPVSFARSLGGPKVSSHDRARLISANCYPGSAVHRRRREERLYACRSDCSSC